MITKYATNIVALVQTIHDGLSQLSKPDQDGVLADLTTGVQAIKEDMYGFSLYLTQLGGNKTQAANQFDALQKLVASLEFQIQSVRRSIAQQRGKELLVKFFQDAEDAESMADQVLADLAGHDAKHRLVGVSRVDAMGGSVQLECRLAYKLPSSYICVHLSWPSSASKMVE